jgi:hypothetical protein
MSHRLIGYRKSDEEVAERYPLPTAQLALAKHLAQVRANDPDAVWPYPLRPAAARRLATAIGVSIDPNTTIIFWRRTPRPKRLRQHPPSRLVPCARPRNPCRVLHLPATGRTGTFAAVSA